MFDLIANLARSHFRIRAEVLSFDTIKVRLQTSEKAQFKGPLDCLLQTVRHEGVRGLYKGATPPLVGWMFMDSMYGCSSFMCDGNADEPNLEC